MGIRKKALAAGALFMAGLLLAGCNVIDQLRGDPADRRREAVEDSLMPAVHIQNYQRQVWTLQDRMKHHDVPGVSIAVIHDGRIDWARGYGVLATEWNVELQGDPGGRGLPRVDSLTQFQAASLSKPVTAMGVLAMERRRAMALDRDINTYLTRWQVPQNRFTRRATVSIRRILSHSAGFNVHGFDGYSADRRLPEWRQIVDGLWPANNDAIRVVNTPGTQWDYSGGGYTVLQYAMEDRSGMDFTSLMDSLVFEPLGMTRSTFMQPMPESLAVNLARAHDLDGELISGAWHDYPEQAAAGLWTTPSDLARWIREVQTAVDGDTGRVLTPNLAREMVSVQFGSWGLGLAVEGKGDGVRFLHGGANRGYRCQMIGFLERPQGLVVMTNSSGGRELIDEIVRAVAEVYDWPAMQQAGRTLAIVDHAIYVGYEGMYRLEIYPNDPLEVRKVDDNLYMRTTHDERVYRLYPASRKTYFSTENGWQVTFEVDTTGYATGFRLNILGEDSGTFRAERIPGGGPGR